MSKSVAKPSYSFRHMHFMWFSAVLLVVILKAGQLLAEAPIMSAEQALESVASGDIVLIDIRSEQEWKESGLAAGAWPISMHRPDFATQLQTLLAQFAPEKIALICATGGRSSYIAEVLERNGITGIVDVSEGMFGNQRGTGWIEKGLPLVDLKDAADAYDAARDTWAATN